MIYVDTGAHQLGRMVMCHMFADSTEELIEFARRLGISPRWIQKRGSYREHFDISNGKRAYAIRLGAKAITRRDVGHLLASRRKAAESLAVPA